MKNKLNKISLLILAFVLLALFGLFSPEVASVEEGTENATQGDLEPEITDSMEGWKQYLRKQLLNSGFTETDYLILHEVFFCESSWVQYEDDGSVRVSNGNYGLAQINRQAHEDVYTAMGLDPNDAFDNIDFAIFLYGRDGLSPWRPWSGWCWEPKTQHLL